MNPFLTVQHPIAMPQHFGAPIFLTQTNKFLRPASCLMGIAGDVTDTASHMKTVLKDTRTGLLFRNMDEWTASHEDAAGFRDTLSALKFCQRNNLTGVAVVHVFSDGTPQRVVGFHRRTVPPPVTPITDTPGAASA
jgi:hypothetical protein